jgi:hypothetical protein
MIGSFSEYVTEKVVIDLIIKERVKSASKGSLAEKSVSEMQKEVQKMTPSRNAWRRLRKRSRPKNASVEQLNADTLRNTIYYDLKQYRNYGKKAPKYLRRLLAFVAGIIRGVNSEAPLDFTGNIKVIAQFKKDQGDTAIYRPLSVYESLEVKTLISLASAYLTVQMDNSLHEEILAYRPKRDYHGKKNYSTSGDDAIIGIKKFIDEHKGQPIYVAECDIQKFYDIINHDVVLDCFAKIAQRAQIPDYHQVERILKAYLDSYSFSKDIMSLNDNHDYWISYRQLHEKHNKNKNHNRQDVINYRFEWVCDDCFKTCYESEYELNACKHLLGILQGGALSCIIANVVLNSVDEAVVEEVDSDRFFVRYGDDILLAHTDYDKCCSLMDAYVASLQKHHLPYHPFKSLSECKDGARTLKTFWDMKSKSPFLWGPGDGNAFEWIGFVGYEIRYTGHTRLRKSTLDKKFAAVNKRYHSCFLKDTPRNFNSYLQSNRRKIAGMASSLTKMRALDLNDFSIGQVKSLDRYRIHKIKRLDLKLNRKFEEEAWKIDFTYKFVTRREESMKYSFFSKLFSIDQDPKRSR